MLAGLDHANLVFEQVKAYAACVLLHVVLLHLLCELYDLNIFFEYLLALEVFLDFCHLYRSMGGNNRKGSVYQQDPEQIVAHICVIASRSHDVDIVYFICSHAKDDSSLGHHEAAFVLH